MSIIARHLSSSTASFRALPYTRSLRTRVHLQSNKSKSIFLRELIQNDSIRNKMAYCMSFANEKDEYCLSRQPSGMMEEQLRISEKQLRRNTYEDKSPLQQVDFYTYEEKNPFQKTGLQNKNDNAIAFTGCMLTALETEDMLSRSLLLGKENF